MNSAPAWSDLRPDGQGLVPTIVQDLDGNVRMLAHMNQEAFEATRATGRLTFWSRSRDELWTKGDTSGNWLKLESIVADCDGDALLVRATPAGPTCHTGSDTCFGPVPPGFGFLATLWSVIADRAVERPDGSYTASLLQGGPDLTGRKVVEEATEVLVAAKNHAAGLDDDLRLAEEAGDLLYHLLVALAERNVDPDLVMGVLRDRHR